MIDLNAKWLAEKRKKKTFTLNYNSYKLDQSNNKRKLEQFKKISNYKNNLSFELLVDQSKSTISSEEYKEKRDRWHNILKSDIYINESINVLSNLKTKKIQKKNILAKAG